MSYPFHPYQERAMKKSGEAGRSGIGGVIATIGAIVMAFLFFVEIFG
jgi:hypothetical protein